MDSEINTQTSRIIYRYLNAQLLVAKLVIRHHLLFCCLSRLREGVRKMEEKHFSDHTDEHVEFLPVEWRSKLTLDGGVCVFLFFFFFYAYVGRQHL